MPGLLRLACLFASALSLCIPEIAAACSIEAPPPPPPQTPAESDAEFAARSRIWYSDLAEAQRKAWLPRWVAKEDRLWATAHRVVIARVVKVGSTRVRAAEGQYYKSPLVHLRAVKWLKGNPSPRGLKVHYLSAESCDFGGVGDASEGEVGDVFLLFYRRGPLDPGNVLDTYDRHRAVTARSQAAFAPHQAVSTSRPPSPPLSRFSRERRGPPRSGGR